MALVFKRKGHHYITGPDYQEEYARIWTKVYSGTKAFQASWEHMVTIGLHAIPSIVLDKYYVSCALKPLSLRVNVPCAGTATIFALLVGWEDAQSAYGLLLREHEETHELTDGLTE